MPTTRDKAFELIESTPDHVHPVTDVRHPGAALEEEPLRFPRPELCDGVPMSRLDATLGGVYGDPEHFGADIHACVYTVPGVDENAAPLAVREVLFAGLTVTLQRREGPASHQPESRRWCSCLWGRLCASRRRRECDESRNSNDSANPPGHSGLQVKYARTCG